MLVRGRGAAAAAQLRSHGANDAVWHVAPDGQSVDVLHTAELTPSAAGKHEKPPPRAPSSKAHTSPPGQSACSSQVC